MFRTRRCAVLVGSLLLAACTLAEETKRPDVEKFRLVPHEPSGVVALGPGRLLVIEDEKERPFYRVTVDEVVTVDPQSLIPTSPLNDLEGITRDTRGRVYAVTSHTPTKRGKIKPQRERLARFRVGEGGIEDLRVLGDLKRRFTRMQELQSDQFEIEGLAWRSVDGSLLFGLRGPLLDGHAVVLALLNPDEAFDGAEPRVSLQRVDLGGQSVRGMEFDDVLGGFVIIGGSTDSPARFDLWLWDGDGVEAVRLEFPAFHDLRQPEGICRVMTGTTSALFVVSDDGVNDKSFYDDPERPGARNNSTPGSYLLLYGPPSSP